MKIKIKRLSLRNFKGIKNFDINFEDITNIYGDNATGKTTIADAFSWLLWDKDSLNRKDFGIKTYDKDGKQLHNLEHTVEGLLEVDGQDLLLSKTYKEVWTKKRGSLVESFTGHTTDYYINEVPVKKKEYEDRISSAVDETNFNLLSNPLYFNQILGKKERRDILLSLIDIDDYKAILEADTRFIKLDLENYSIDEIKAMAKSTSKKINKDIESIPVRIDELNKSRVDYNFKDLYKKKTELSTRLALIDTQLASANNISDEIKIKNTEIFELESEIRNIENIEAERIRNLENDYREKLREIEDKRRDVKREIGLLEMTLKDGQKELEINKEKLEKSRVDYVEIASKKFDESFDCPVCGQEFPTEKKEEIINKFNVNKSQKLEEITKVGKIYKKEIESLQKEIQDGEERKNSLSQDLIKLVDPEKPIVETKVDPRVEEAKNKIKVISLEIEKLVDGDNFSILEEKEKLQKELEEVNEKYALKTHNAEIDERIHQYEKEEKELAKEYEKQQEILYLAEEYTKAYVELISSKINNLFENVEFKLFDVQINGGIVDTAEALIDGVPFSDANSAAKINAGLDVINAIGKHLEISVPIFVDNAESVNKLIDTDSQLVRLVVSDDKELRVE